MSFLWQRLRRALPGEVDAHRIGFLTVPPALSLDMDTDQLTRWLFENVFTILLTVLIGVSSYMLKATLEDLRGSIDRLSQITATQNVRLGAQKEQIKQLNSEVERLEGRIDVHSDRWTDLYKNEP